MPPSISYYSQSKKNANIVTLNVGGQIFQTTKQTLTLAGSQSLLYRVSQTSQVPFIDRDPNLFSILLSFLRTGYLPSKSRAFDLQDIFYEARHYGIEPLLMNSQSNSSQFDPFNLEKMASLPLNSRESPSAISATHLGSVHVAHGCKITSFDSSLRKKSTVLTEFSAVDSLLAISPSTAAAGATDFSGLKIINLDTGLVKDTLGWENTTPSSSTVQAIGRSPDFLFASFESGRRNSSAIVVYDLQGKFIPISIFSVSEIYGADLRSAIPATKLDWIPGYNLLMASGSHSDPSGVSGTIKLWDIRSGRAIWEHNEKEDCFSDITVSEGLLAIFKVGVNSGGIFRADLRSLGGSDGPWVRLGEKRAKGDLAKGKEGFGCKIESYGNRVIRSKGGCLEVWSEVLVSRLRNIEDGLEDRVFRMNKIGRVKDSSEFKVTNLGFGGNKMFVARKDQQSVEVWESCLGKV